MITGYPVVGVELNTAAPLHALVWGTNDVEAITLNSRGDATDRVAVQLGLEALASDVAAVASSLGGVSAAASAPHVVTAFWLPGSPTAVVVVLPTLVKIFDLASDALAPVACFRVVDTLLADATVSCAADGTPQRRLIALTHNGLL